MWIDAAGQRHPRAQAPVRIVSLVPSLTETLFALGLGAQVVGRTGFCVRPRAQVARVPKVGGTKDVDLDRVRALQPTHVLVNIDENEKATAEALARFVPHVVVTHPLAPEDNLPLLRMLGGLFDRAAAAQALVQDLRSELQACRAVAWPAQRVLYLIWKDPWMTVAADTYIARTLALLNWQVLHGPGGFAGAARYPRIDLEREAARVDRVLLSTEPYRFRDRHRDDLRARFPGTPVDLVDGQAASWYGVRAIAGLRELRALRAQRAAGSAPD